MNKRTLTDLEVFINIFNEDKMKVMPGRIEYRGMYNLEGAIAQANRIIKANRLRLEVVNNGQLASYKAFEVVALADGEAAAA